jgi:methyltransferase (TIGR00027 family)
MNMEEKQAGVTAVVTAYSRAYHATHDFPLIFNDFLADQLFTPEEHVFFNQAIAGLIKVISPELESQYPDPAAALAWVMQHHNGPITLSRSRYCENCLRDAVAQGMSRYVILGAGLDTFAFRRLDWAAQLEIFEVDHPVTQAEKRRRIAAAGWTILENLHFVPVDFAKDDLAGALRTAGFQDGTPAFFSWLGVTYYLTREEIAKTLKSISEIAPAGSILVFDYMDGDITSSGAADGMSRAMNKVTRRAGEPMKTCFDPASIFAELEKFGLHLDEALSPAGIEERYFSGRSDAYHACWNVHFIRARMG